MTLSALGLITWLAPGWPVDPWNLLIPRKIAAMIFALALIQAVGTAMVQVLGARAGAILSGFFGGLVSSTATTASLARHSAETEKDQSSTGTLTFLSATMAMLIEGLALVLTGTKEIHYSILIIFLGPILATMAMIVSLSRNLNQDFVRKESIQFHITPIFRLSIFIVGILSLSKLLQNAFGQTGLFVLTFSVSMFEIHGSVIANVQIHENGTISVSTLGTLIAISVFASYLSKLFLISSLGSRNMRREAIKNTFLLFLSLIASLFIANSLS